MEDTAPELFRQLSLLPALRKLSARYSYMTYSSLLQYFQLRRFHNLSFLYLTSNKIADEELKVGKPYLQAFSTLTSLSHLDLSHNEIREFGVLLNSSSLRTLDLSGNLLTDIPFFCDNPSYPIYVLGCPSVTHLDLSNNKISLLTFSTTFYDSDGSYDVNVQRIAGRAFRCLPNLLFLDLSSNYIHMIDMQIMCSFRKLQTLYLQYQIVKHLSMTDVLILRNNTHAKYNDLVEFHLENHSFVLIRV
jgi:Leucine-rich repeat (LRR) protein